MKYIKQEAVCIKPVKFFLYYYYQIGVDDFNIVVGSDGKEHMVCTGCRKQQDLTGVFSYCPNCGAKMMEG